MKWLLACRRMWNDLIDVICPPACPSCRRGLTDDERAVHPDSPLCTACRDDLQLPEEGFCQKCGAVIGPYSQVAEGCLYCRRERFAFGTVIGLGTYDGMLRKMCVAAKMPGGAALAGSLAELLYERRGTELDHLHVDLVTSVPEHWTERLMRSHNAPAVIARVISHRLKADLAGPILRKVVRTRPQTSLSPTARRREPGGAFSAGSGANLMGARVLLVDDVLTTGATANAASRVLLAAGAGSVSVAVLARGIGSSRSR